MLKIRSNSPPEFVRGSGPRLWTSTPGIFVISAANGLNWKPRFVLQSYSAYHPNLDQKCAEDYRGKDAPRYILYLHETIDTQHPCIVDPQTWMEIYRWYDVADQVNDILLLERRSSPRWDGMVELGSRSIAFGERWEVPENIREPVILRVKLRLNPIGDAELFIV